MCWLCFCELFCIQAYLNYTNEAFTQLTLNVAQLTPHQVLVEPAYQPYLNQLDIIIYAC